jgi:hypothetical protein
MWVMMMARTIGAYWVVVVMPIDMLPIQMMSYAMIWMPPTWPIVPIERRMPTYPRWSPEPIINNWTIDINRFYNIICTIYIFVTNNLHSY